jgi:Fe2+ transport system protein FeoA
MMPPDAAPLTCFMKGQRAKIAYLNLNDEEAQRLRDLGLREGCYVCIMSNAEKCIVGLSECRIALQREVASHLLATPA